MATATAPAPAAVRGQLSAVGVLRSEWIKLRTVRSTLWCYGLLIVFIVGLGILVASLSDFGSDGMTGDEAGSTVVGILTGGVIVAVLIVAVLGSLVVTGEYSTGMIRSTFAAVPHRTGALAAKAVVLAATTFAATSAGIWLCALMIWPILSNRGVEVQLGDPSVFLPLLGGALYVTMIALLALGFGTILRSTAGALATVLGIIMIAPVILQLLGGLTQAEWVSDIGALLPQNAGSHLYAYGGEQPITTAPNEGLTLNGWQAFGVLAAWDGLVGAVALMLVKRRDA